MKKIIAVVAIVVLGALAWFYFMPNTEGEENLSESPASLPWIEVDSSTVTKLDATGKVVGTFATGDTVEAGMTIATDESGKANVYFADGSTLRIDPNTKLTISEGSFDEETGSLRVRVALSAGKLWSKITALVTPESHWEVNTGSAVATVRGSAFGTEVTTEGETLIIGSEHDVFVAPVDPDTGELIADAEVVVGEEERKEKKEQLLSRETRQGRHVLGDWVRVNEERDKKSKVPTRNNEDVSDLETELDSSNPEKMEEPEIKNESGSEEEVRDVKPETRAPAAKPKAESLDVKWQKGENKLNEGATLEFEASLVFSDASIRSVTNLVDWQVVGSIGRMKAPGVFEALLGNDVSEIGTAFGAVTARFTTEDGQDLLWKSDIITVNARVDNLDERG
jgi:prepilin-type processing-associated H-X9-DG protein